MAQNAYLTQRLLNINKYDSTTQLIININIGRLHSISGILVINFPKLIRKAY